MRHTVRVSMKVFFISGHVSASASVCQSDNRKTLRGQQQFYVWLFIALGFIDHPLKPSDLQDVCLLSATPLLNALDIWSRVSPSGLKCNLLSPQVAGRAGAAFQSASI